MRRWNPPGRPDLSGRWVPGSGGGIRPFFHRCGRSPAAVFIYAQQKFNGEERAEEDPAQKRCEHPPGLQPDQERSERRRLDRLAHQHAFRREALGGEPPVEVPNDGKRRSGKGKEKRKEEQPARSQKRQCEDNHRRHAGPTEECEDPTHEEQPSGEGRRLARGGSFRRHRSIL
jgi:hypothetical protein